MREFELYENKKFKCPVCGCRNKVHTELIGMNNKFKGYSLKCCACGNVNTFLNNHDDNGLQVPVKYTKGKETCMRTSFCPFKTCKLYKDKSVVLNEKPMYDNTQDGSVENVLSLEQIHESRFL